MASAPDAQLTHIGLFVQDIDRMKAFYCEVLGMTVSDGGHHTGRDLVFLTRNPDEHHQLVLARDPSRPKATGSTLNQLSFRLKSLEDLREFYRRLESMKVEGLEGRDHGNSWSAYFFDPEGNKIELYVPTPWHVSQPWRAPLDLTQPVDAIVKLTEGRMKENPTSRPMADWSAEMRQRLKETA